MKLSLALTAPLLGLPLVFAIACSSDPVDNVPDGDASTDTKADTKTDTKPDADTDDGDAQADAADGKADAGDAADADAG